MIQWHTVPSDWTFEIEWQQGDRAPRKTACDLETLRNGVCVGEHVRAPPALSL